MEACKRKGRGRRPVAIHRSRPQGTSPPGCPLTDALLEVKSALRDADHRAPAKARDVADQVSADAGRLKPAVDRSDIADAGIQLAAKVLTTEPWPWLAATPPSAAPMPAGSNATGAPLPASHAASARGQRGEGVFDGVQNVVEVAAIGAYLPGREERGQHGRRRTQRNSMSPASHPDPRSLPLSRRELFR